MKDLKRVDFSIEDIKGVTDGTMGETFLGDGASKMTYAKDEKTVVKIPQGWEDWGNLQYGFYIPEDADEVEDLIDDIVSTDERFVWSYSQFAMELMVWDKLVELAAEGYDISHFAKITNAYTDVDGIPVIEQERAESIYHYCQGGEWKRKEMEVKYNQLKEDIKVIRQVLRERWNIDLYDIREDNMGVLNGELVIFDYGLTSQSVQDYPIYHSDCFYSDYCSSNSWC